METVSSFWDFGEHNITLDAPPLKVLWEGGRALSEDYHVTTNDPQARILDKDYIHAHGSCKPTETYQWGFSYIFLFMISIFNFVWSCIMVGIWMDTTRNSRTYKSGRRPGLLRSILDVSAPIREQVGDEYEILKEEELRKRLRGSGGALMVPEHRLGVARTDVNRDGLKKRGWRRALTEGSSF